MVIVDEKRLVFLLQTKKISYAFGVDDDGLLHHLYWGVRIEEISDLELPKPKGFSSNDSDLELATEEYPVFGGLRYKEHCLKVHFVDGVRDIVYHYQSHEVNENSIEVCLKDKYYNFEIILLYKIYEDQDLIERSVTVKNHTKDNVEIEAIYSGQIHIPHTDLTLTASYGHWLAEFQEFKQSVGQSKLVLENRRGISTHNHNPFFILDYNATENNGEVYFGALKWSGNFKTVIEPRQYGTTLVQMGLNPHDCQITLRVDESFTTPAMIFGYTNQGFAEMSHHMHDYAKTYVLRNDNLRPVLYNSWEATLFDVTCDGQINLAKKASEMGVELFVVDDGWFGNRNNDTDGLGDWYVNQEKFPHGLNPLINEVKKLGMMFGIWIEPEMVNPPTKLLKEHPDWIYHFENRETDTARNQMVLNVTLPEVQEFIFQMIDNLLANHDIDYIKWDANRPISQTGNSRDMWIRHIEAVYDIMYRIKDKYPDVLIEACASGGGRVDYGSLSIFDDFWTSDNTDPYDRLIIQKTYSYMYPIKAMRSWVTDHPYRPNIPLSFKFHTAMMGTLGMGCDILQFTKEQMNVSAKYIQQYKEIRHIVQNGDFYRLQHQSSNDYRCFEYLHEDEVLLFVLLPHSTISRASVRVRLQDLNPSYTYTFDVLDIVDSSEKSENVIMDSTKIKSGAYLMNHGATIQLQGDYASTIIYFRKDSTNTKEATK